MPERSSPGAGGHRLRSRATPAALGARLLPALIAFLALAAVAPPSGAQETFIRADSNGDGMIDISDVISSASHMFLGHSTPCRDAIDANDTGTLDIADLVFTINILMGSSSQPIPLPYPTAGLDPTQDSLDCTGGIGLASSITQGGFTWNFAGTYETGQFVNGDWYVVGPVTISSVSPGWTGTYDGSMINPVYSDQHGYDSRWNFESSLRANTTNLQLLPGQSLVTVDSWRNGESGAPSSANTLNIPRPAIKDAAVLTCLASHPPAGTFRPPYGGSAKPLYNVSQLRTWLLPELEPPSNTPTFPDMEEEFEGVWLDHTQKWKNRYLHPEDNMDSYSRNFASDYNTGALMLMLDYTLAQKQTLLIRLVQIGIDQFAILESGGEWGADAGGIGSGRKWPILFAGIMLDDPDMMSIGTDYGTVTALEDCQTFYLTSGSASDYPGESIGDPVWGERHCHQSSTDPGNTSYRTCCTANAWVGAVLAVHILTGETAIDVKALWNHDPLFDYQDRYMAEQDVGDWKRSWSAFQENMWDTYRSDYGPIWTP